MDLVGVALALAFAGCVAENASSTATPEPPTVLAANVSLHPDNALVGQLMVSLSEPGRVYAEYQHAQGQLLRTATTAASATTHHLPLVRLVASSDYAISVYAVADDGRVSAPYATQLRSGPLPAALARLQLSARGTATAELTLLDLQDNPDSFFLFLDSAARIVWYHRNQPVRANPPTPIRAVRQKPNGNLVYWEGGPTGRFFNCCLREIDVAGAAVDRLINNEVDKWAHHDLLVAGDDQILYLAHEIVTIDDTEHGGDAQTRVLVDSLRRWDQRTHSTEELWNARDQLALDERVRWAGPIKNWLNANSLALGPRGNVIISLAARNEVISLAPDLQSIEWRLGGPNSTYEFIDPTDRFYFQHTVSELPNGNILLFDNGRDRPPAEGGAYSRALELTLNTYDLSVVKVWEYRHEPDLYAASRSSAYRLANGNTLVNFETNEQDPPRIIIEADAGGNVVWQVELRSPTMRNSYRAYPASSIAGEHPAEQAGNR